MKKRLNQEVSGALTAGETKPEAQPITGQAAHGESWNALEQLAAQLKGDAASQLPTIVTTIVTKKVNKQKRSPGSRRTAASAFGAGAGEEALPTRKIPHQPVPKTSAPETPSLTMCAPNYLRILKFMRSQQPTGGRAGKSATTPPLGYGRIARECEIALKTAQRGCEFLVSCGAVERVEVNQSHPDVRNMRGTRYRVLLSSAEIARFGAN